MKFLTINTTTKGMKNRIPIIPFAREYWYMVINFQFLAGYGLREESYLSLFEYADSATETLEIISH
tara:strand:+ start:86 stop:283 length:198 start_codon:yes stop_codon:yes gene_type:complete